ncbi:acyltransferase family protein [Cryptosporangium phraense]|uniref:acyltransferase family protein n=1 Tax=Cryptosporangium phraense TaxID=2593070 RepID=UPI001479402C|nr:acyltransferase family protein [Cryptosporangium phraense]
MDGLRALAVTAVLVYHLGASWLPGGFLGVDLFFVLSGFLITTLLLDEWAARGRLDLGAFWLRRARRLLPPALLVVAAVMVVGWRTVDPSQLASLRSDGLWTLFYGANWHLIGSGQSYFDAFAAPSPLRHAWSLAIEEQFYLVWPLLLLVLVRVRRFLLPVIVGLIAVSAVLMAVRYSAEDPSRAYYGTDTRVFELLIGAAAAVVRPRVGRVLTAVAGAGVLVAFASMQDEWVGFYRGGAVAFAVVAAVLVVGTVAHPNRVLTARPVVALGLISYGVYLWHWPVYCWLDDAWLPTTTPGLLAHGAAKIALTLALSVTSYFVVEKPVRRGAFGLTGRRILLAAPTAIAAVAALTLAATAAATAPVTQVDERNVTALSTPRALVAPTASTELRLATVGDSVVKSLSPGLATAAEERGWSYTDASVSSCSVAGLLMLEEDGSPWSTGAVCPQVVTTVQQRLIDEDRPDVILVHSRWETYRVRGADGDPVDVGTPAHRQFVAAQLRLTMERLTSGGARVVWIDSTPMTESLCRRLGHDTGTCAHTAVDATVDAYTALRRQVAAEFHGRVTSLSLTDLLCDDERCPDSVDGRTLRPDGLHFTAETADAIVPDLLERVAAVTQLP